MCSYAIFIGSAYHWHRNIMIWKSHKSLNVYIPTACVAICSTFFIDQGSTLARSWDPQVTVAKKRFNGRFWTVIIGNIESLGFLIMSLFVHSGVLRISSLLAMPPVPFPPITLLSRPDRWCQWYTSVPLHTTGWKYSKMTVRIHYSLIYILW